MSQQERYVIGAVMCRPELLDEVELRAADFVFPLHRAAWGAALELKRAGISPDPLSVAERLKPAGADADPTYLLEAMRMAAGFPVDAIRSDARHIADEALRRNVIALTAGVVDRLRAGDDTAEVIDQARHDLAELGARVDGTGPVRVGDMLEDVFAAISDRMSGKGGYAIPTGLLAFDKFIGPLRPARLIVVAARPGVGKTSLVRTWALHASKRRIPVLLFSLEMSRGEQAEAWISAEADYPADQLSRATCTADDLARLRDGVDDLRAASLWVDDRMLSASQIAHVAKAWRARQKAQIGLVIVDYLGLIKAADKSETRALEVGRMAWAMKSLATEIACPVVLVAQLNRNSEREGRKPVLSDLRDSGEIEQHAHQVIFPHREVMPGQGQAASGPAELIVAKNRSGAVGLVPAWWHAPTMTFGDAP